LFENAGFMRGNDQEHFSEKAKMPQKNNSIVVNVNATQGGTDTATIVSDRTTVDLPGKYNVIMHNDDVTPMRFVVEVLVDVFKKERSDAIELMLKIHIEGKGVVGTYLKSIAEAKLAVTREISEKAGYDKFKVTMEKA